MIGQHADCAVASQEPCSERITEARAAREASGVAWLAVIQLARSPPGRRPGVQAHMASFQRCSCIPGAVQPADRQPRAAAAAHQSWECLTHYTTPVVKNGNDCTPELVTPMRSRNSQDLWMGFLGVASFRASSVIISCCSGWLGRAERAGLV